jgi:hypothetical protein
MTMMMMMPVEMAMAEAKVEAPGGSLKVGNTGHCR